MRMNLRQAAAVAGIAMAFPASGWTQSAPANAARQFLDAIDRGDVGAADGVSSASMGGSGQIGVLVRRRMRGALWTGGGGGRTFQEERSTGPTTFLVVFESRYELGTLKQELIVECSDRCRVSAFRETAR